MAPAYLTPKPELHHLVILGAGASRAALPHGDKHGQTLPLMADLVETLGLPPLLRDYGVSATPDFELLYSSLADSGQHPELLAELERRVWSYFSGLELPDRPTLYDYLVLSLCAKDFVATFNWDPLLWQALSRAASLVGRDVLPQPLFLHGNVGIGHCLAHQPATQGDIGQRCRRCGQPLVASRLLFPIARKNYTDDPAIARYWEVVKRALSDAYCLTVFGYRAPASDAEAMEIFRQAWGAPEHRRFEEVEIVDIRPSSELAADWKHLIHSTHYSTTSHHGGALLARHPRRSCEDFWEAAMMLEPQPEHPLPPGAGWDELLEHIEPLVHQEREHLA